MTTAMRTKRHLSLVPPYQEAQKGYRRATVSVTFDYPEGDNPTWLVQNALTDEDRVLPEGYQVVLTASDVPLTAGPGSAEAG